MGDAQRLSAAGFTQEGLNNRQITPIRNPPARAAPPGFPPHASNSQQTPPTGNPSSRRKNYKTQLSETLEDSLVEGEDFINNYRFKDESKLINTKSFEDGYNMFLGDRCLGVIGGPKTGKSTLISQILHWFRESNKDYKLVYVTEDTKLDKIRVELKSSKKCVLILDNMFAMIKYTPDRGERWLRKFDAVNKLVESRVWGIVFTMNAVVYNACKATFRNKPFFKNIIKLYEKDYVINEDFKRQILAKHRHVPKDGSGAKFIEDACKHSANFVFLSWCQPLKKADFKSTFKQSLDYIEKYMEEILASYEKEREVLFLVLFMGGHIDFQKPEEKPRRDQLSTVFPGLKIENPKSCCEIFEGTFLKLETANKFGFVEPVIEYVTLLHAFKTYGQKAFEWCSLDVIMELISLDKPTTESLTKEDLKSIVKSICREIVKTHRTVDVALNYKCLRYGPFLARILPEFTDLQSHALAKRLIPKICEDGDIECLLCAIKYIQQEDEPVDAKGRSLFEMTIYSQYNDDETINKKLEVLIRNKCNYTNVDRQSSNVFHLVAEKRGIKCLEFLLQFEELVGLIKDDADCNGRTPLHIACIEHKYEAVQFFLNNCGDKIEYVNKPDNKKRTALHYAVEYLDAEEHQKTIELLLKSGAKIDIEDGGGKIPLHEVRHCSHGISEVVKLLGSNNHRLINKLDKLGLTPLHLATKAGNVEAVRVLLSEGADVTIEDDDDEMTALMLACQECVVNSRAILQLLLEAESDPERTNRFGLTALQEAVSEGNIPCVEALLQYGADPNKLSHNAQEEAAVHIISRRSDSDAFEMFKLLHDHGADVNIRDSENKTVFDRVSPELLWQIESFMQNNSVSFV